uniref:Uncharacterized protein n=1 Tax=Brassica oleracea TaxID=3712 RepID=A0A3P6EKH4_BRAOL|nr:unnamed protein product [Brassica oleracea]
MRAGWFRATSLSNLLLTPPFPFPCAQDSKLCRDLGRLGNPSRQASLFLFSLLLSLHALSLLAVALSLLAVALSLLAVALSLSPRRRRVVVVVTGSQSPLPCLLFPDPDPDLG